MSTIIINVFNDKPNQTKRINQSVHTLSAHDQVGAFSRQAATDPDRDWSTSLGPPISQFSLRQQSIVSLKSAVFHSNLSFHLKGYQIFGRTALKKKCLITIVTN